VRYAAILIASLSCAGHMLAGAEPAMPAASRALSPVDAAAWPGLYVWTDTCNVYVLRDGEAAILVNSGDGSALDHLAEIGVKQVEWVLFTDHHREQCQGALRLKRAGARLAAPASERAIFEKPAEFRKLQVSLGDAFTIHGSSYVRPPIQPTPLDRALQAGDVVKWHGHELQCLATPGSSPGGMAFRLRESGGGTIFSGDVMLDGAKMHTWFDTEWDYGFAAGIRALRKTVDQLEGYELKCLLPSHGPPIRQPKEQLRAYATKLARLENLYVRGYGMEEASVEYQDKVSKPTAIRDVWQVSPHLFKLKRKNFWPNFGIILADSGRGLVMDCGLLDEKFLDDSLQGLRDRYGLKAIDAVIVSHMHGDHFLEAPHLREKWGAKIWAIDRMVDKMEHPEWFDYAAPIQAYGKKNPDGSRMTGARVNRVFHSGETFTWEGYKFTIDWMPGQTEFALCLHGRIDGRHVAFTGDNIFGDPDDPTQTGHEAMVAHNSAILEEGYIYGAEYLKALKPDLLVGGHSYVMDHPAAFIERYRQWSYEMRDAFRTLSSESDYRYWFDLFWVRAEPYRLVLRPGHSKDVKVYVRNFRPGKQAHRIEIHAPPGLVVEPAVLEGELGGEARQSFLLRVKALPDTASGVRIVGLDVSLDGHRYGEWFDFVVGVEAANKWTKVDEGKTGTRTGAALLWATDLTRMLLVGPAEGAACVQAFDPASPGWRDVATATPTGRDAFHPYYQAAYDPGSQTVYCLSGGPILYSFCLAEKKWKAHPAAVELDGLSWHTMACEPVHHKLVVVGADKKTDNLGWSRTVVYDIPSGKWSRLEVADPEVVKTHRQWVDTKEACINLAGRIRLTWYHLPKGARPDPSEMQSILRDGAELYKKPWMRGLSTDLKAIATLVQQGELLSALKAVRGLQRKIEEVAERQYPDPCSRRNSSLAFDERNGVFVLFGGDHEDYLLNDTWVLDMAKRAWRRASPDRAPSPRAGHALCGLPRQGGVALYEGYVQNSSSDYGAVPYRQIDPRQLWRFDPKTDRWDLVASCPLPASEDHSTPAPLGFFDGYAGELFCPPALAADTNDSLVLAAHACGPYPWEWKRASETWALTLAPSDGSSIDRADLATPPNQRLYRAGPFRASYCEVDATPKDTGLERLPENRWVRLPDPSRNPCTGCRQRDWGTCVWDSDRDQILHWGGGHCVRAASTVAHYSPVSGRIVEGFDADEPYSANGGGGFDSSLLNRPWVSTHNYHHYAYDPNCKLLVSGRGYLYDPGRMDWLRLERIRLPFTFDWAHTYVARSRYGAVAWARKKDGDQNGLWLFNREQGWIDLQPRGDLFEPYCDAHGMVYDSTRDRMIFGGVGGGYQKLSDGRLLIFDFQSGAIGTITPANRELAKTHNAREMVYVDHADWILLGELYPRGEGKPGCTRIYDCCKNKMCLLDAGDVPFGHSTGWMYDARRRLVYVFTFRGEAWALNLVPATATLLEK
jgi:glyoxylase-like metal-dependent hydrolase (beta-lactamase superfamily II)